MEFWIGFSLFDLIGGVVIGILIGLLFGIVIWFVLCCCCWFVCQCCWYYWLIVSYVVVLFLFFVFIGLQFGFVVGVQCVFYKQIDYFQFYLQMLVGDWQQEFECLFDDQFLVVFMCSDVIVYEVVCDVVDVYFIDYLLLGVEYLQGEGWVMCWMCGGLQCLCGVLMFEWVEDSLVKQVGCIGVDKVVFCEVFGMCMNELLYI